MICSKCKEPCDYEVVNEVKQGTESTDEAVRVSNCCYAEILESHLLNRNP